MQRGQGGDGGDTPDASLPFLSAADADLVRRLFRAAMAERGRELVAADDGNLLRDANGANYGLRTIAVLCRDHPAGANGWPELVAGYADALLNGHRDAWEAVAAITPEQARGRVYPSIRRAASLGPAASGHRAAPELAPGLLELLALDLPDATMLLDDGEVARLGGREPLREAALANLRALPVPRHKRAGTANAHFEVIIDDHFTASRVLVMPDLVSRVLGTNAPHGVLAAIPARNFAFIHVLADKAAAPSLGLMANTTRTAYEREQVPISPDVFWWRDGDLTPIPSVESDGKLILRPGPELGALLTDLAARPHPNEFS
jgi:uncharacterized protein YtpQ (UPF0354 family)